MSKRRNKKRLTDGRKKKDYPCKIVVRLSRKQMAYAEWVTGQLYGSTEYFAYSAVVKSLTEWWKIIPDDVKKRVAEMDDGSAVL